MNRHQVSQSKSSRAILEQLDARRLLAAAAGSVQLDAHAAENELSIGFVPDTVMLRRNGGYLTGAQKGRIADLARTYVQDHAAELGLKLTDVQSAIITDQYTDSDTGISHVYMQQTLNGLPIQNTSLGVHFVRGGRVLTVNSSFVKDLASLQQAAARANVSTMLHPANALRAAANALEIDYPAETPKFEFDGGNALKYTVDSNTLSLDSIPMQAQYVATADGVQLAWKMVLRLNNGSGDWYDMSVNAQSGKVIFASNWTDHFAASYNVFPLPMRSPDYGPRQIVNDPWDLTASPFGWHDTNGVAGAENTTTIGNNVSAQDDADNNNTGGLHPDGGASLNFDFPLDLAQQPINYRSASITNLFYWNNVIHDIQYKYGFTESAGNFQTNNYGRGGAGNDAVQADAQDGFSTDNARFSTPADGSAGRMEMFLFTSTTPQRDGSLESNIMIHEYGHGVSNRLTGGPANANALNNTQSGGMGEGWSDWFAMLFTQQASDTANTALPQGTYVLGQPVNGAGIRRRPYSFDKNINPLTFEAYGSGGTTPYGIAKSTEVHDSGEIWAQTLWDMNWLLINKYGYDSNLYTGYNAAGTAAEKAGNKLAMRLVLDGMKLQPANPSFTQARDAILAADTALTGGANAKQIWLAFARRGLGSGASTSSSSSLTVTPSFDVPAALFDPLVTAAAPSGESTLLPKSSFTFNFNEAVNPASFSVVDDVASFTGPGGVDLKSSITTTAFTNSNKTLTINYTAPSPYGVYTMTIGPNITAADNGAAMDQDIDGTPGEASDSFTTSYTLLRTLGPDAAGYQAGEYPVQNIDLVVNGAGVTTLVNGTDDGNALLTLPAGKSFNFYGNTFTSMSVSANGLISFGGTATTSASNGDLTTAPTLATIAALWDDWRTDVNLGVNDSAVLYSIDSVKNTLTIEWSDVVNFNAGTASNTNATFQAILQLNTGATPGRIVVNYKDIDIASATLSNGGGASVGVKDSGAQSTRRLLVNQNSTTHPWVKNAKAVVMGPDVIPPTVAASTYEFETAQTVNFAFDENVGASVATGDFTVTNLNTTLGLAPTGAAYNSGTNTAALSLPTTLDDGNYQVVVNGSIDGSGVTDAAGNPLDGDNSGLASGNYVYSFFFLRGDANRDRTVNLNDFTSLASHFGQSGTFADGDFNYSGSVNLADFTILASQFGKSLPALRPAAGASNVVASTELRLATRVAAPTSPFSNNRVMEQIEPAVEPA